jgi:hypothetical protein
MKYTKEYIEMLNEAANTGSKTADKEIFEIWVGKSASAADIYADEKLISKIVKLLKDGKKIRARPFTSTGTKTAMELAKRFIDNTNYKILHVENNIDSAEVLYY